MIELKKSEPSESSRKADLAKLEKWLKIRYAELDEDVVGRIGSVEADEGDIAYLWA